MIVNFIIQQEDSDDADTIGMFLHDLIEKEKFGFARIAVAYATLGGVNRILSSFEKHGLESSQWVIGLSDLVTQPSAFRTIMGLENSEVKVATTVKGGSRFHPKLFQFGRLENNSIEVSVIGSANMTPTAFKSNVETMAFMQIETSNDLEKVDTLWTNLWNGPTLLTEEILSDYTERYEKAKRFRKVIDRRVSSLEPSYQATVSLIPGMLWWKKLSKTDAQQATSGRIVPYLRLTKSKSPYDTQAWFRDTLFADLNWKAGFFGKHNVEEAKVDIFLEVDGVGLGCQSMIVTHDSNRQYNNNTPNTWIHFDDSTQRYLASNNQTGKIAVVTKDTSGRFHFIIQSEIP